MFETTKNISNSQFFWFGFSFFFPLCIFKVSQVSTSNLCFTTLHSWNSNQEAALLSEFKASYLLTLVKSKAEESSTTFIIFQTADNSSMKTS